MINQLIVVEMALAAQRERMVEIERTRKHELVALAGQNDGPVQRAGKMVGAFVQRMGRPLGRGSAPAVEVARGLDKSVADRARLATPSSVSTARF